MTTTLDRDAAVLAIALHAAFADGGKHEAEREEFRRIADMLSSDGDGPDARRVYQDVLLKHVSLEDAAAALAEPGEKHLAYELAVGVCDADGRMVDSEREYLDRLRGLLGLDRAEADEVEREAEQVVEMTEAAAPATVAATAAAIQAPAAVDEAAIDKSILNYSILNGALEILPQSWASMAVIPLQIKMVYEIGQRHGVALDRGHIKEFLATLGVGMTSQYIEQFGRKLIGGLFRAAAGRGVGRLGRTATGMAFSFATTYALGQVARRYYAGGRQMSTELLRSTFQETLGPAKQMQQEYLPQIEQKAQTLDMGQVMGMVRGGSATSL
ncbi:MAG: GTPase [Xanthomonadales bacterium]|nr:GTPase [Xanthomonadales bacterium]